MTATTRFAFMSAGLGGALVAGLGLVDTPFPWQVRTAGAATLFLTLTPGLKYLADRPARRRPVPFLPVIGLIYGIYFGRPFAFGFDPDGGALRVEVGAALLAPALLALLGWLVLLGTYWLTGRIHGPRPWNLSRVASAQSLRRAGVLLITVGLVTKLAAYLGQVPTVIGGVWSLFRLLGWVGAGFLVASWTRETLDGSLKLFTVAAVLAISVLEIATGMIANPGRFWLVLLLAAWLGNGRRAPIRWWATAMTVVLAMVLLRGVAGEFRQRAWFGADLGPVQEVEVLSTVVEQRLREGGVAGLVQEGAGIVERRTSQAVILADVVQRTPEDVPFWGGETYVSLVGAFVPRFVWPSKPVKNLGQRFGHRYSYLAPDDRRTSVNFPFLVEFYANFGVLGIAFGMALVGSLYRFLDDLLNRTSNREILGNVLALALLVPVMTNVESDFSLVFGGLILNGIALFAILMLLTRPRTTHLRRAGG